MRWIAAVVGLGLGLMCASACSSSASNLGCSCSATVNGESKDLSCGESACLGGTTATCGENGGTSLGGPCAVDAGSGTSSSGTSGTSSGCSLFSCSTTKDCGGIAPCFSTGANKNFCYEHEASADACSKGTTATTKQTNNGATTICVPSGCPQPVNFLQ